MSIRTRLEIACGYWSQHEHADKFNALHLEVLREGRS
jgi:hypothetical protein